MKRLKVLCSLIGLFVVFFCTNVSAMEDVANERYNKVKLKDTSEFYNKYFLCGDDEYKGRKFIRFNFASRKRKNKDEMGYAGSTEIAEKVLRENIGLYKRMLDIINKRPKSKIYALEHFDLLYVRMMFEKYLDALKEKAPTEVPNNQLWLYYMYLRAFRHWNSQIILDFDPDYNDEKITGLFSYSVVFKINEEISGEFFNSADTNAAKIIFDQILEFFVVFLEFYEEAYMYEPKSSFLTEWEQPELKETKEYALLYPSVFKELWVKEEEIANKIKEKILKEDKNLNYENFEFNYKGIKYNGLLDDLFKFYEKVYNEIAYNEKLGCPIFNKVAKDEYFQLFNPKNIESIHILKYVRDIILLKFKEDRFNKFKCEFLKEQSDLIKNNDEFLEQYELLKNQYRMLKNQYEEQSELLKNFKSFDKNKISYLNSLLGVLTVKQIISTYLSKLQDKKMSINNLKLADKIKKESYSFKLNMKKKKEFFNKENKYKTNLEGNMCKISIRDVIEKYKICTHDDIEKIKEYIKKNKTKYSKNKEIRFNGESKDLYNYYKEVFNDIVKNGNINFLRTYGGGKHYCLFIPESIKRISFLCDEIDDVLIEYVENYKFCEEDLNMLKLLKSGNTKAAGKLNILLSTMMFKEIIMSYLENCKYENVDKNKKHNFYFNIESKDFESEHERKKKFIYKKIEEEDSKFYCVKYNGESEDLTKFCEIVYDKIFKDKYFKFSERISLFNPEILKNINVVNDEGLCKIILEFNEDVEFNESQINILKCLDSDNAKNIECFNSFESAMFLKEIILIYLERVKYGKEIKNEIYYATKHKYKIHVGGDIECLDERYKQSLKEERNGILKNILYIKDRCIIKNSEVKFNGDFQDLYKFYSKVYKRLLMKYKNSSYANYCNLDSDVSFKLLAPNKLKYIRVENIDGASEILLEYKEDVNFNASQLEFLDHLRESVRYSLKFVDSSPGISLLKLAVLTYFEAVKDKKKELDKLKLEDEKEGSEEISTTYIQSKKEGKENIEKLKKEEYEENFEKAKEEKNVEEDKKQEK